MAFDAATAEQDEALLVRYGDGDPFAARLMAERFLPIAYRVAVRQLGAPSEAEDVAQEAMMRLFRAAPQWQGGRARVTSWLYRVVVNLCIDRRRGGFALPIEAAPDLASGAPGVEEALTDQARLAALNHALAGLPERQRMAVVLRHIEGLSNPEIAAAMDIGLEAVESLTARGKRALAEALAGHKAALGYEEG